MGNTPQETLSREIRVMEMVKEKFKRDREIYPEMFIEVRTAYRHSIRQHHEAMVLLHIAENVNKGNAVCINCGQEFDGNGVDHLYCSTLCYCEFTENTM